MRLAQKASGLLKGLRPSKQPVDRRADGPDENEAKPSEREVARSTAKEKGSSPNEPASSSRHRHRDCHGQKTQEHGSPCHCYPRRCPSHKLSAQATPQDVCTRSLPDRSRTMSLYETSLMSDDTDSDDEPDESVMEDMKKLEESFEGISRRYRLINRIGEGQPTSRPVANPSNMFQAPFPLSIKLNSCSKTIMSTWRTTRTATLPKISLPRNDASLQRPPRLPSADIEAISSSRSKRYMSLHRHTVY